MDSADKKLFLDMLKKVPAVKSGNESKKNYFDVAGYPHYENVASNILAFFFDTEEEHGFKDLWLKSLIECYMKNSEHDKSNDDAVLDSYSTDGDVWREEYTEDGKYIDLLITADNGIVIAIENKIFSELYNPLESYHKKITGDEFGEYRHKFEIILSLKNIGNRKSGKYCFINITYSELFDAVKKNSGRYMYGASEKWLVFMNEFMKNIEGFTEEDMCIDKDFQIFLEENTNGISDFINRCDYDAEQKISMFQKIHKKMIENGIKEFTEHSGVFKDYRAGYASIYMDITVKSENPTMETSNTIVYESYFMKNPIDLKMLYSAIWCRKNKTYNFDKVKEIFSEYKDMYETKVNIWGNCIVLKKINFSEFNIEKFVEESEKIIKTLYDHRNEL